MCAIDLHGFVTYRCPRGLCPECTFKWTDSDRISKLRRIKICSGCRNIARDHRMTMQVMPVESNGLARWDADAPHWRGVQ